MLYVAEFKKENKKYDTEANADTWHVGRPQILFEAVSQNVPVIYLVTWYDYVISL